MCRGAQIRGRNSFKNKQCFILSALSETQSRGLQTRAHDLMGNPCSGQYGAPTQTAEFVFFHTKKVFSTKITLIDVKRAAGGEGLGGVGVSTVQRRGVLRGLIRRYTHTHPHTHLQALRSKRRWRKTDQDENSGEGR